MSGPGTHNLFVHLRDGTIPNEGAILDPLGTTGAILVFGNTKPPDDVDGYSPSSLFVHTDASNPGEAVYFNAGTNSACRFIPMGLSGMLKCLKETVSLDAAAAKYVAMSSAIPSGAVILSVQANLDTLVVAGGTTVKVAIGLHGGDVDAYGKTSALTKNLKISTAPSYSVLSGETTLDVCGVVTDGSALGDSNFTAGTVTVQVRYLEVPDLPDAD